MKVMAEAHQRGEHLLPGREKGTREKGTRQRVLGKTPEDILEKQRYSRNTVLPTISWANHHNRTDCHFL